MTHTTQPRRGRPWPADHKDITAATILDAAVQVCLEHGYPALTSALVAVQAGVSPMTVSNYYTPDELRAAVCRAAIDGEILSIIAEAVAARSPHVAECPVGLRTVALQSLAAGGGA